jgi:hypothetical protein
MSGILERDFLGVIHNFFYKEKFVTVHQWQKWG